MVELRGSIQQNVKPALQPQDRCLGLCASLALCKKSCYYYYYPIIGISSILCCEIPLIITVLATDTTNISVVPGGFYDYGGLSLPLPLLLQVPIVIRGPGGVGRQLGAEHSQRLESYFQSIPGVQLVACSTVANSKALLKSAIRSDNPIIFFEHVLLYNVKGELLPSCEPKFRTL